MKKAPALWNLRDLPIHGKISSGTMKYLNGQWVPARPIGLYSVRNRLRLAWMVFTGMAR